jgi:predicted signal transduction protein with EAL and GGDEF domain
MKNPLEEYFNRHIAGIYNIDRNSKYPLVCENASIALYMAEHVYKTRELVFEEDMKRELIKEQKIISLFPQALKDGEFCVYYQPKVDLTTSSMYGSEALVRWNKDGEVISPGYFIPVLEQENILYKLDFYVLEQVCKDMRR